MATEIYICRKGQALKDGKVEYSHTVTDKASAESDAQMRCRINPAIAKIAYYQISESGDFKIFYSYTNPAQQDGPAAESPPKPKKKVKPKPKTLLQKIKGALTGGAKKPAKKPMNSKNAKKKA